jgi:hypothetical protein
MFFTLFEGGATACFADCVVKKNGALFDVKGCKIFLAYAMHRPRGMLMTKTCYRSTVPAVSYIRSPNSSHLELHSYVMQVRFGLHNFGQH